MNNFDNKTYYNTVKKASQPIMDKTAESQARLSKILGIISLASMLICCIGSMIPPVLPIISIILAVLSRKGTHDKKMSAQAKTGFICSIVSIILFVIITIFEFILLIVYFDEFLEYYPELAEIYESLEYINLG